MEKMSVLEKHGFAGLNRWPNYEKLAEPDAIADYFINGYAPQQKLINKNTVITAFGSCFAGNVSRYLTAKGYTVNAHDWDHNLSDLIRIDEIMVHTPALRAQFEWAFEDRELGSVFIGTAEEKAKTYHCMEQCKAMIRNTDFFIITLGLTEAWYDKLNQQYLWKFVPNKKLDPDRFENRFVSFAENMANLQKIYQLIRQHTPNATIVMTLSPIPLLGTYHGKSVIAANTASKATLRAVLHEFLTTQNDDNLFYFPSYEIVNFFLQNQWKIDFRHITPEAVEQVMQIFDKYYLED